MYFDFKANVFKLQITCKDKGEGGGMCVGRQNQQLRETESLLDRPTVRLMSL